MHIPLGQKGIRAGRSIIFQGCGNLVLVLAGEFLFDFLYGGSIFTEGFQFGLKGLDFFQQEFILLLNEPWASHLLFNSKLKTDDKEYIIYITICQ